MKSGAGSPFEDDFDDDESAEETETADESQDAGRAHAGPDSGSSATDTADTTSNLPYKYRRDGVQDDRDHGNIFLRDVAQTHVDELVDRMDETFQNESVYKIDVLEAAILAAGEPDKTVEDELRKMGYGMK
ncbi:hypothetical protein [Haloarcula argentinensis]|uniref:Uncharacterized protein n=1 Tax=Haloarcula argentinensis TaxID=43776 RepID=A0A830FXF7_HALAR|nr:hypothetical protein [Haloarcula argentinensis]EMA26833.1 hypothetical protein C443_00672 [Haloarcula argentinensis DSM 12282]MDS0255782.1 hypothetical protein [Haloarcula argentinensis]GGM51571.1 hypothetical protein GCM10009006_35950 [Haloarcula argentinensis]